MAKIVISTLGTLGDVRPFIAIAQAAEARTHEVTFATSESFGEVVASHGLRHASFGNDDYLRDASVRASMVEPIDGFGFWMGHSNLRNLEELYDQLANLCNGVDLLLSNPLVIVSHLVAETAGVPLVSCSLSPAMLLSDEAGVRRVDPHAREWRSRLNALRQRIGLPRSAFPQMERFTASLNLGLYPRCLGGEGRYYMREPIEIGYPTLHSPGELTCPPELAKWISEGPYVLVSFGSYIDRDATSVFDAAISACENLGLRCLYLSPHSAARLASSSDHVFVSGYIPHGLAMAKASVIVHHGGTGTLAAAIEAGRPMVVTPFGLDQTSNAASLAARDLAEVLPAEKITAVTLSDALSQALKNSEKRDKLWRENDWGVGPHIADLVVDELEGAILRTK
jgi:UDP:flavonoid glycosyltransferase YjiC (YdhE family)